MIMLKQLYERISGTLALSQIRLYGWTAWKKPQHEYTTGTVRDWYE